jgi:4-amino-4-deoxy-L-arabinose transferase-like glycosyltransferase
MMQQADRRLHWCGRLTPGLLVLIVLTLVFCRWPALEHPLFWDELGVYAPSVYYLLDHGVSIQPSALDPELSRGHPMLYVFSQALLASWLGESSFTLHLINLGMAACVVLSVFFLGRVVFGRAAGLLAAALFCAQPLVHAQATLILPEMSLALAVLWMLIAWYQKRWLLYLLAGLAAVWLKETAMLVPGALVLAETGLWWRGRSHGERHDLPWSRMALLLAPWLGFVAFLLLQKAQNGWYLFPYHTSLFDFSLDALASKLFRYLRFLFWEQGRWLVLTVALGLAWQKALKGQLRQEILANTNSRFAWGAVLVFLCWLGFSMTNAYLNRYLLALFPLLAVLAGHLLWLVWQELCVRRYGLWLGGAGLLLMLGLPWALPVNHFVYDDHPRFDRHLQLTETAVQELVNDEAYRDCLIQCNWPIHTALESDRAGFREQPLPFYLKGPGDKLDYRVWLQPGSADHPPPYDQVEVAKQWEWQGMHCIIYRYKDPE